MGSKQKQSNGIDTDQDIELQIGLKNSIELTFPYPGDSLENLNQDEKDLFKQCKNETFQLDEIEKCIDKLSNLQNIEDKNGMNILHILFFNETDKDWFVKNLEKDARENVVKIIELLYKKCPEFRDMVVKTDNNGRTPLHYAGKKSFCRNFM